MKDFIKYIAAIVILVSAYMYFTSTSNPKKLPKLNATILSNSHKKVTSSGLFSASSSTIKEIQSFKGKWTVLYFGFTSCAHICPMTMSYLSKEFKGLGDKQNRANLIMVTVDPKTDRAEVLKKYVQGFYKHAEGLYGDIIKIKDFAKQLGAYTGNNDSKDVIHSEDLYLISPKSEWVGVYRKPHKANAILDDLLKLIGK